jgi:hydroxyacylglutathione hydrolase
MLSCIDYGAGIVALDSGFIRPWLAAVYLLIEKGRAAVLDAASNHCVPRVLQTLDMLGIRRTQVDYVILTHIHLDHAGGAGSLLAQLPNARLCVHPRGVRHMVDPSALMQGTIDVYGRAHARKVYGDIAPVDAARILATAEGDSIELAGRALRFLETPGHARHHCCVHDSRTDSVFTGDTFGLGYRELAVDGRRSVFPTTSPVQFEPDALHASIRRIVALRPARVYLTHFGGLDEVERLGADLHRLIDAHVALAQAHRDAGALRHERLKQGLESMVLEEADRQGWRLSPAQALDLFATDIELNAQGLGVWLERSMRPGMAG